MGVENIEQSSFASLSKAQRELLKRIIEAFKTGVEVKVARNSKLCENREFVEYFANLFSVYHSITEHKFEKKSFEFAFKYAAIAAGYTSEISRNTSHQGEDVTLGSEKISLKTEGEKTVDTFKISKFSEARFIAKYKTEIEEAEISKLPDSDPNKNKRLRELRTRRSEVLLPRLVADFQETIQHHLASYDRIVCLKANATVEGKTIRQYRYRLFEIPKALLERSLLLSARNFRPLRGNGGTSASVTLEDGARVFGITIDGSVEKISITGIKIANCLNHAEFLVPVSINNPRSFRS